MSNDFNFGKGLKKTMRKALIFIGVFVTLFIAFIIKHGILNIIDGNFPYASIFVLFSIILFFRKIKKLMRKEKQNG